jgi:hypothetical protein
MNLVGAGLFVYWHFLQVAKGDEIRLYNSGGEVAGSSPGLDIHFHFVGVLLYSNDKN